MEKKSSFRQSHFTDSKKSNNNQEIYHIKSMNIARTHTILFLLIGTISVIKAINGQELVYDLHICHSALCYVRICLFWIVNETTNNYKLGSFNGHPIELKPHWFRQEPGSNFIGNGASLWSFQYNTHKWFFAFSEWMKGRKNNLLTNKNWFIHK